MRHINKDFNNPPAELIAPEVLQHLNTIIDSNGTKAPNASYYQRAKSGFDIYNNKCAYCEQTECEPQVEHYRPKKGLQVWENGQWKRDSNHKGYYWLSYEWSNLLPACYHCNRIGDGKGARFPTMNPNVAVPTSEAERSAIHLNVIEKPYLLHPEIDYPERCLTIHRDGTIEGTDEAERGKMTIKICNLQRENLIVLRKEIIDDYLGDIKEYIALLIIHKDIAQFKDGLRFIVQKFQRRQNAAYPFSLTHKCFSENYQQMLEKEKTLLPYLRYILPIFEQLLQTTSINNPPPPQAPPPTTNNQP
ncbi:MAG TPA: hypothetical protein PKH93_06520 [Chitinophagales bacterium]|nr:hypothetical protein [Chitinophagales bacterium]